MLWRDRLVGLFVVATAVVARGAMAGAPPPAVRPHLEHVAVWAADLDETAAFLHDVFGWRRHPIEFGVREDSTVFGGMKLAFVDANGFWIELVQPTTPGPGMDFLKQKGDGSIVELDFFVEDFEAALKWLEAKGIPPHGMDDKPIQNGGLLEEWARIDGEVRVAGERLAYLPLSVSRGTSIELGWEYPTGVVVHRDNTWGPNDRTPAAGPRMDHVTVAAADFEKTLAVYTGALELKHARGVRGFRRDWMGVDENGQAWVDSNGPVWINVVAPTGAAGKRFLADPALGDGVISELAVEVADIDAFTSAMKQRGIVMTAGDGAPLTSSKSALTGEAGDRYCYLPRDKSHGMRIVVFQRGSGPKSALNQRDAARRR